MAISSSGSLGSAQSKTAGTTLALTTSALLAAGAVGLLLIALDNTAAADAQTSEVSAVRDSASNNYLKLGEFCNAQGSAGAGATVSVWASRAKYALPSGGTVTVTFANSITAKAASFWSFSVGDRNALRLAAAIQTLANDGADPGSMSISGLASKEYLFLRALAGEDNSTAQITPTTDFTAVDNNQTSGGAGNTNMGVRGEFRILTGTSATSDPSWAAIDNASVMVALEEYDNAEMVLVNDGATIWVQHHSAVRYVGARDCTYCGWVSKNGDVRVGQYNHSTGVWRVHTLYTRFLNNTPSPDDHTHPLIYVHTDGTVVAFYGGHDGNLVCHRSLAPENIEAFGAAISITTGSLAYPRPIFMQSTLYCFYRKQISGNDRDTVYKTSTDGGATWSSETTLINGNGARPYAIFRANGADRIDFCASTGNPAEVVNSIYHFYFEPSTGKKFKSDATEIGAGGAAITTGDMTLVYDGTTTEGWNYDIIGNGASDISIAFATFPTPASDHRYRVAKWAGSSWSDAEVVAAGGPMDTSTFYSGGIAFYDDGNTVILSRDLGGGEWRIEKYTLSGTWSLNSTLSATGVMKRTRPVVPLNHHATDLNLFWMEGAYTNFEAWDTKLVTPLPAAPTLPSGLLHELVEVNIPTSGAIRISCEFPPKLMRLVSIGGDVGAASGRMIMGATDGIDSWSFGYSNQISGEVVHRFRTANFFGINNLGATTVLAEVPTPIFDAYGASVTPTTFPGTAFSGVYVLILGGDAITAKVGTFNTQTGLGDQDVTAIGIDNPKLFEFVRTRGDTTAGYTTGGIFGHGVAHDTRGSGQFAIEQWASDIRSAAGATSDEQSVQRTDACLVLCNIDLTIAQEIKFVQALPTGFRINHVINPGAAITVGYWTLAGNFRAKVDSFNAPTSNGDVSYDTVFSPKVLLTGSHSKLANSTPTADHRQTYGLAIDPYQQKTIATAATDAQATWNSARQVNEAALIGHVSGAHAVTVNALAVLKSLDNAGFTLTWNPTTATARQNVFLALGNPPSLPPLPRNPMIPHLMM